MRAAHHPYGAFGSFDLTNQNEMTLALQYFKYALLGLDGTAMLSATAGGSQCAFLSGLTVTKTDNHCFLRVRLRHGRTTGHPIRSYRSQRAKPQRLLHRRHHVGRVLRDRLDKPAKRHFGKLGHYQRPRPRRRGNLQPNRTRLLPFHDGHERRVSGGGDTVQRALIETTLRPRSAAQP